MSTMTRLPGVPDQDDLRPGMASYHGSGPAGQTCETCRWRGYWRPTKDKVNPRTQLIEPRRYKTMACKKFLELSMRHGPPVKGDYLACSYWETKHGRRTETR